MPDKLSQIVLKDQDFNINVKMTINSSSSNELYGSIILMESCLLDSLLHQKIVTLFLFQQNKNQRTSNTLMIKLIND